MPLVAAYHRPDTVEEALVLLASSNRIPLGGGTAINADRQASEVEVVDLQGLGLDTIDSTGDRVDLGAMASLRSVMEFFGESTMLGELAKAEAPSTLRTLATIGGTVAGADAESALLAALLVHEATIAFATGPDRPLGDVLANGLGASSLITRVSVRSGGQTGHAATGRTPADTPIVSAAARKTESGIILALSGVAEVPQLVDPLDPTAGLNPPGDFRGSTAYRLELARTLARRVIGAVQ